MIASTGAQRPVLTLELLTRVQRARRGRPLSLLDIAVPRDVEPAAGKLDGIYLFDIDDLQKEAGAHRAERQSEAAEAEAIVEQELGRFLKAWRGRQVGPTVTALRAHVLGIAEAEAQRLLRLAGRPRRAREAGDPAVRREHRQEAAAPAADGAAPGRRRGGGAAGRRRAAAVRSRGGVGAAAGGRSRGRRRRDAAVAEGKKPTDALIVTPGAIVIGTRGSALARWQAAEIGRLLRAAHPGLEVREEIIVTAGDRVQTGPVIDLGGKGVWVEEIESALSERRIDLAVHSMKDVPAELAPGLAIVAIPTRADPRDAIVSRTRRQRSPRSPPAAGSAPPACGASVRSGPRAPISPPSSCAATSTPACARWPRGSSTRRCWRRPGSIGSGFSARIVERLDVERMLPAIGQGALALEARADDAPRRRRSAARSPIRSPRRPSPPSARCSPASASAAGRRSPATRRSPRRPPHRHRSGRAAPTPPR